jgi:sporulation protein YlmC with PRC-barrel domain
MAGTTQFTIGADVSCTDGVCGEVYRVVVDPLLKTVTHLVVEPKHRQALGRLVPLELVDTATGEIRLHCTVAEFEQLAPAEEMRFLPGTGAYGGYGPGRVFFHPYYALGGEGMVGGPLGISSGLGLGVGNLSQPVTYDKVPVGEVELRRGEQVHATDGDIGRVQGLVMDRDSHRVTHVLLQEGHLWGRKQVAIPISEVAGVDEGIRLKISKQQVQDLPEVDIEHPNG